MPDGSGSTANPLMDAEQFLEFYHRIRNAQIVEKEAKEGTKAAKATAKAAGMNMPAFKSLENLLKMAPERAKQHIDNLLHYASILHVQIGQYELDLGLPDGPQLTERVIVRHREWQEGVAGRRAGFSGEPRDNNPNSPGSSLYDTWDTGWRDGVEARKAAQENAGITDANDSINRDEPPDEDED